MCLACDTDIIIDIIVVDHHFPVGLSLLCLNSKNAYRKVTRAYQRLLGLGLEIFYCPKVFPTDYRVRRLGPMYDVFRTMLRVHTSTATAACSM